MSLDISGAAPAGTRYRKRGLSDLGHVANECETEQIVEAGMDYKSGQMLRSSVVRQRLITLPAPLPAALLQVCNLPRVFMLHLKIWTF